MKRIIIIGEGQTEQAFCNDVLQPYFNQLDIYIENPTIKKSRGGIISWIELRKQINMHLKQDNDAYVTLLIDYYGIHASHQFPGWNQSLEVVNKSERMSQLEDAMRNEIDEKTRHRFIPYIQLHEFEGLLFSDQQIIEDNFDEDEFDDYDYLVETIHKYSNPEMINDGSATAPSKRLKRIIKGYGKIVMGSLIAQEIGLTKIRGKCPRFNEWINILSQN